jgi:non-ribosomal peptide synthase protein (TIGR01720 family)
VLNTLDTTGGNCLPGRIGFNFLGEFAAPADAFFRRSTVDTGAEISPVARAWHALDLSALISDGRLSVQLHYDGNHYSALQATVIGDTFSHWLEQLVSHCCTAHPLATADFDYNDLTPEEFAGLVDDLVI